MSDATEEPEVEPPLEDDDDLQPSTGALLRGIALIVAAVALGIFLLQETEGPSVAVASDEAEDEEATEPVAQPSGTTTSTTSTSVPETTTTTTAPTARPPDEVTVLVANGAGVPGAAARLSGTLGEADYDTAEPSNTPSVDASVVYFVEGYQADAEAVAALLSPAPSVQPLPDPAPVEDLRGAQVVVVQGPDLAGEAPADDTAETTTSTTAPG